MELVEIWRPVKDWDWYEVSNLGRVRNVKTNHILKPLEDAWGYLTVGLYSEDSPKKVYNGRLCKMPKKRKIHQLVAEAFCDGYEDGFVPDHIDHNRKNNRADNLRWVSRSVNAKHMQSWANRKIDNYTEPVVLISREGERTQFGSIIEASVKTGLDSRNISANILGRRKGFVIGHFELLHKDTLELLNLTT